MVLTLAARKYRGVPKVILLLLLAEVWTNTGVEPLIIRLRKCTENQARADK